MTDWVQALGALLPGGATSDDAGDRPAAPARRRPSLFQPALQLDLVDDPDRPPVLRARPMTPRASGGWQSSGTSWGEVGYAQRGDLPGTRRQRRLLVELLALSRSDLAYSRSSSWLDLSGIDSRRVWDLLCELRDAGLPFVGPGRPPAGAVVHDPVTARLDVRTVDGGLSVTCGVYVPAQPGAGGPAGEPLGGRAETKVPSRAQVLGEDGALAWWVQEQRDGGAVRVLHVAPVPYTLAPQLPAVLGFAPVEVPAADVERFVAEYLPLLQDVVPVRADPAVPVVERSTRLHVTVTPLDDFSLELRWAWQRRPAGSRDRAAEARLVGAVRAAVPDGVLPHGARPDDVPSFTGLPGPSRLAGLAAVRCAGTVLPALRGIDGVDVEVVGELPRYRMAEHPPELAFEALRPTDRDWYDLSVSVTVEGEGVPFVNLFTALVKGHGHLVLPSGTLVPLRDGRFAELVELIETSHGIPETDVTTLRVNRYDPGVWDVLERVGTVEGRAREWRDRARAVAEAMARASVHDPDDAGADGAAVEPPAAPEGITATLRPYQRAGVGWLVALHAAGLGGVLADDMGLGKTLQTLALVQHVRDRVASGGEPGPDGKALPGKPFLVVAPTSVVSTWEREAARFAPGLRVVTVTGTTRTRGGSPLATLAADADVVVTSYALFRLEHRRYAEVSWEGLVLDEAQNVKNHTSAGYRCARDLGAPWTLAITGTPVENTLMELWALVSLVAPGLLPTDPQVFNDVYRLPVERAKDGVRLDRLRRRVAPILLRRTKEQVAPDLPERTEQVLEVDLSPAHRRAYQALLVRERTKVLGLVDDLPRNRFKILRSLTLLRQAALDIALVDEEVAAAASGAGESRVPSTKLDVLVDLVDDIVAEGHRVLVFSQFTRFLRSARDRVEAAGHGTCYLDGTTRRRAEVVDAFRSGDAPVFLISLKAGGTGLTLTEADYVVVLDPWWNPATEAQAVDRTHRIGQVRNVMVYRLVARDTVEEKVMALKEAKAGLVASILDGEDLARTDLTPDDVRQLLG